MMGLPLARWTWLTAGFVVAFVLVANLAWFTLIAALVFAGLWLAANVGMLPETLRNALWKLRRMLPFAGDVIGQANQRQQTSSGMESASRREASRRDARDAAHAQLLELKGVGEVLADIDALVNKADAAQQFGRPGFGLHAPAVLVILEGSHGTGKTHVAELLGPLFYGNGALPSLSAMTLSRLHLGHGHGPAAVQDALRRLGGGVLILDDVDWMVALDKETMAPPAIKDIGPALAEGVRAAPQQFLIAMTGTPDAMERLLHDDDNQRWLSTFHQVVLKFPEPSLDLMLNRLEVALSAANLGMSPEVCDDMKMRLREKSQMEGPRFGHMHAVRQLADELIHQAPAREPDAATGLVMLEMSDFYETQGVESK